MASVPAAAALPAAPPPGFWDEEFGGATCSYVARWVRESVAFAALVALPCWCLPSVGRADGAPAPSSSSRALHVAVIGDSLSDPKSHGGKYLAQIGEACPEARISNFAKGGTMVNQMRKRLAQALAGDDAPRFSHVIVFGGVNDLVSDETAKRTPAKVERDLAAMYRAARDSGAQVIAVTIAPWGAFKKWFNPSRGRATREVNAWIREQGRVGAVDHVVDAYALLSCDDKERLCEEYVPPFNDGLHFGPPGHAVLGRAVVESAFSSCR